MNKKYVMYAWLGLLAVFIIGLVARPLDLSIVPLWLTEAGAIALLALYLYRPNNWTALGALGSSATWLINQVVNWYGNAWMWGTLSGYVAFYVVTATIVCLLGFLAFTKKGKAPLVGILGGDSKAGLLGFAVMGLFGFWKIFVNVSMYGSNADLLSRCLWGVGVGLMGFGTAWSLKGKGKKEAVYLIMVGLLLATVTAIAFGKGLSLIS